MTKLYALVLVPLVLTLAAARARDQTSGGPEIVVVHSGSVSLHAMLWRAKGRGPFPGVQERRLQHLATDTNRRTGETDHEL